MLCQVVLIAAVLVATVSAGVFTPNPSYKGAVVLDDSPFIATGTPFQKAKISESVVDLIGGTPLVLLVCLPIEVINQIIMSSHVHNLV